MTVVAKNSKKVVSKSTPAGVKKLAKTKTGGSKKTAARRGKKTLNITVVDKHHHVLKPIWDAVASGAVPSSGVKFLHFDSHPDMGVIGADDKGKRLERSKRIIPKIFQNKFNKEECLRLSDIATWIPTLAAQGLVDEVIWCAGWWCTQFDNGSWDLIVGRDKNDGMMKIAVPGDRDLSMLGYWGYDGSIGKCADLVDQRPWKLHVVKFQKNGKFTKDGLAKIVSICKNSPWILDIDEDYLSCQNPFTVEFVSLYGQEAHDKMAEIYRALRDYNGDDEKYMEALEKIVKKDVHLLSPSAYSEHEFVKTAVKEAVDNGVSRSKAVRLVNEWRVFCRKHLPQNPDKDEPFHVREVKDAETITEAAGIISVPHHISTLAEMVQLLKSTRELFDTIRRAPGVVTVATSRYDEYTPETQAATINCLILDLLTEAWDHIRKTKIFRRDYRSCLSIDDAYDPVSPNVLALFLSNGKRVKLHSR